MHELMKSRERHADILSLKEAAKIRHTIPATFDGTNPALAFSPDQIPRLKVGEWYRVPDQQGVEIEAQLCGGIVIEERKTAFCTYRTRMGAYFLGTNTLTDDEVQAYKLHPTTFFGIVQDNATRTATTPVEWFDFLFETYQHSSKEKILEFLAGASDANELSKLNQRDLAITYCERMALHMHSNHAPKNAS
jgi:hypothetical protein